MQYLRNQNYVHLEIISKHFPFTSFYESKIKVTTIKKIHFEIHFCLEFRGNQGSSQNFHGVPFSGDCKIITPNHTIISHLLLTYDIYIKTCNLT